jgi:hypothetical protein
MNPRFLIWAPLLASVAAPALLVHHAPTYAQEKVGAAAAVNPDANGTPPGAPVRQIVIGQDIVHEERVVTGAAGQTQLLFLDQSSLALGPAADLTIDNFVYDPSTSAGRLAMSTTKGVLRYVGGALSKNENAVTIKTPSGELGIRGGTFLLSQGPLGQLEALLLYGNGLRITPNCPGCIPQLITRPGFYVSIPQPGAPAPAPPGLIARLLAELNGEAGRTGGSRNPPTEAALLASGLSNIVSFDFAASDLAALSHLPPFTPPPTLNPATIQTDFGLSSAFSRGRSMNVQRQQQPQLPPPPPPPPYAP